MNKELRIVLALIGAGVFIFAVTMFVMAIRFGELGRVVFYFAIAAVAVEVIVLALSGIRKK